MKKLYMVRHAESEHNVQHVFSGHSEPNLTDKGLRQAQETGKELKDGPISIDLIICSPTKRTTSTAEIIAEQIGYPKSKIITDKQLIERHFGDLEGTSGDKFYLTHKHKDIDKVPNAETVEDLSSRVKKVLEDVKKRPEDNILFVTHGATGRAMLRELKDLPATHEFKLSHRMKYRIGNAEVVELI
jgi:probable phosphoglycerate mutase